MSSIPKDLKYTTTHEWVRKEDDGTYTIDGKEVCQADIFYFCMENEDWQERTTYYFPDDKLCAWCSEKMRRQYDLPA